MPAVLSFNSIDYLTGLWSINYNWAKDGFTTDDLSSYLVNPLFPATAIPALNPFHLGADGLSIGAFSVPPTTDLSLLEGRSNVSGLLSTAGKFQQQYGYFEVSAKLPSTPGVVSAFWLVPASGQWPPELDAFEISAANPTAMLMTAHDADGSAMASIATVPNTSQAFHTYAVDWTATTLTWYFDGTKVYQTTTPQGMHQPMYMLLDTMTGTPDSWEGQPTAPFSDKMTVAYAHAYTSNPLIDQAATVNADQITGTATTGMKFIYSQDHHQSTIEDFNPLKDVLLFQNTHETFATIIKSQALDQHAIIESDHNIVDLPGVTLAQLNSQNVMFSLPTT